MKQKGGHGLTARIMIDDIPQTQLDLLNSSTVTYEVRDAKTGVLESSVTRPMRSFTANFLRLLWGRMTGTACTGGLDINDTAIDESSGKATNLKCVGAATGLKKFGICIGTGTGAVAQTDNKLTWDTGFSIYGATTIKTATTISGSNIYFEIQKAFTNNTGSTRTIYEAGLCTTGEGTEADNNTNVLIARELTNGATGTAIATGKVLTVVFKISSTFTTDGTINKSFMRQLEKGFSSDTTGATWNEETSSASFSARRAHALAWWKNKWWLVGGYISGALTDVWYSSDGITWTEATSNMGFASAGNSLLVYNDRMYLIVGNATDDVYYTDDGTTWTLATASAAFGNRNNPMCFVYDGKMWVCGGDQSGTRKNDVYYSTNGVTWTQATAGASWSAREGAFSHVYDGKMWIGGGFNGSATLNDVWYSTDGSTWTRSTTDIGWASRYIGASWVYGGKMWIGGGLSGSTYYNDIRYSTDGTTWTQATAGAAWGARRSIGCAFNTEKMILTGGYTGSNKNDVWSCVFSSFYINTSVAMDDYARIDAASGSVYGITVGTDTTNFDGKQAALIAPIADGSGSGELDYGDMTDAGRLSEPTVSGSDNIMRLERDFANNSGGAITIKEVGLSAKGLDALGLLLMRGKVDKAVADGASVRVAIELETSV